LSDFISCCSLSTEEDKLDMGWHLLAAMLGIPSASSVFAELTSAVLEVKG
jgi:hypothetical protein